MSDGAGPPRALAHARDRAAAVLGEAFADDQLGVEEFEARLDRCYRATSVEELGELFRDLTVSPPAVLEAGAARQEPARRPAGSGGKLDGRHRPAGPVDPADRPGHDLVVALMGGMGRGGRWTPPRHLNAVAVMGGVELDFRQARFPEGETTMNAVALMGGVEITVPPGLAVECSGVPIMGGFDRVDQEDDGRVAPGAVLRIRGFAFMGGIEVRTAAPGEELPSGGVAELD